MPNVQKIGKIFKREICGSETIVSSLDEPATFSVTHAEKLTRIRGCETVSRTESLNSSSLAKESNHYTPATMQVFDLEKMPTLSSRARLKSR